MGNFKEKYKNIIFKNKKYCIIADNFGFKNDDEFLDNIADFLSKNKCIISFVKNGITDKKYIDLSRKIKILCNEFNSIFMVNSRADIAFITESSGIILNKDDISVNDAAEILGENSFIGIITDKLTCDDIADENIDFILCENVDENQILNTGKPVFIKTKHDVYNSGNFKTFMIKS
ncbi:MAG: thiamine phosphate synthase [Candidatus Gastranaerophilaceae bacterium]|nr:thiamine-phosphate synthase 1 [Clostridium sp. CAG:967]